MSEIEQFVPAPEPFEDRPLTRSVWMRVLDELRPDIGEDERDRRWAEFLAMRRRVGNCRRRTGGDVVRAGPVLFDPCQYTRQSEAG